MTSRPGSIIGQDKKNSNITIFFMRQLTKSLVSHHRLAEGKIAAEWEGVCTGFISSSLGIYSLPRWHPLLTHESIHPLLMTALSTSRDGIDWMSRTLARQAPSGMAEILTWRERVDGSVSVGFTEYWRPSRSWW